MKLIILLILVCINSNALQLDKFQKHVLKTIWVEGKKIKTVDGITIPNTLGALALRESSLGKNIIGDQKKNGRFKPIEEMSLGVFQIQLQTAKYVIRKTKTKQYYYLLKNNKKLANKLLTDLKFGIFIAGNYFVLNYNEAVKRKMWNPYFKAVSRHNGGWVNKRYYRKYMKNLQSIRKLRKLYD